MNGLIIINTLIMVRKKKKELTRMEKKME